MRTSNRPTSPMPKWPAWALFGAMAACTYPAVTAPGPSAVDPAATYRALGTEPFWSVTLADGRLVFEDVEDRRIVAEDVRLRATSNGRRYESARVVLDITHERCSDGMSDRIYADTVRALVDGQELRGCGGSILPPETLADTAWQITHIGGEDVSGREGYFLNFESNRMSGRAGCNSISGAYRVSSDGLRAGPLAMTRMACPGRMEHEQELGRILSGTVRLYYPDGDTLIMRGEAGEIRLRRSI